MSNKGEIRWKTVFFRGAKSDLAVAVASHLKRREELTESRLLRLDNAEEEGLAFRDVFQHVRYLKVRNNDL